MHTKKNQQILFKSERRENMYNNDSDIKQYHFNTKQNTEKQENGCGV